jgi:hypothetical protein
MKYNSHKVSIGKGKYRSTINSETDKRGKDGKFKKN